MSFFSDGSGRKGFSYPREEVSRCLEVYNRSLGCSEKTLKNIERIKDDGYCIVTGQQAGFLGGPLYTFYKIVSAILLARKLNAVPVFWLATEDHDFGEISKTFVLKADGEVGPIKFSWREEGRPIADLEVDDEIRRAYDAYFRLMVPGEYFDKARAIFDFGGEKNFCSWIAKIWSKLFAEEGLVIIEPTRLRGIAEDFFGKALELSGKIKSKLEEVKQDLKLEGYEVIIESANAGTLYTFDKKGRRIRGITSPHSADVVLRPILADSLLPTIVNILGPGELTYHRMLLPIYDLFEIPQPLVQLRNSYTVVTGEENSIARRYGIDLREKIDIDAIFRKLAPADLLDEFATTKISLKKLLERLGSVVEDIEPNLLKTLDQTIAKALTGCDKLEERTIKAILSQNGFSKSELHKINNSLYPRDRLQERVFPLPHFINRFGTKFIDKIMALDTIDQHHQLIILEDNDDS